LTVSWQAKGIS